MADEDRPHPVDGRNRDALLVGLREKGVLYSAPDVVLTGRDGSRAAWMLYAWPVTMTAGGVRLAASELLRLLGSFEATQLVGFGPAGIQLAAACLALGDDRYSGIVVRPEQKKYGSNRQIDPPGDRHRKVVLVDDSISSGTSFFKAAQILEEKGYEVEGVACLVDFSHRGGRERAQARGYRVETLFNMWEDIKDPGGARAPAHLQWIPDVWSSLSSPERCHPAIVARRVAEHFITTGETLRPPAAFNQREDGRGGVWVSFRVRSDDARLARHGFWHFQPADADPQRDVVLATIATLQQFKPALTLEKLSTLKIAVSFFSPLEQVSPAELDFGEFGIVVQSEAFPYKLGGALPNTQLYTSSAEQYRHARVVNARIGGLEPHVIFRHVVEKRVEPGEQWPAYGESKKITDAWYDTPGLGDSLVARASEIVDALTRRAPIPDLPVRHEAVSEGLVSVCVALYDGGLIGRFVASAKTLDEAIQRACLGAVDDPRFAKHRASFARPDAIAVSLLHDPEALGDRSAGYAAWRFRAGRDSVVVRHGALRAVALESDLCHNSWTKQQTTQALVRKAAITAGVANWTTYKTATWIRTGGATLRVEFGAAQRDTEPLSSDSVFAMGEHLYRRLDANGWPAYGVNPALGRYQRSGGAPRCIQGLHALSEAAAFCDQPQWQLAAQRGLAYSVDHLRADTQSLQVRDHGCGPMADACLLHAVSAVGDESLLARLEPLARRLCSWIRDDGIVLSEGALRSKTDVDFLPGVALLALAKYAFRVGSDLSIDWAAVRSWHRRRFGLLHPWGTALWHGLVWPAAFVVNGSDEEAAFAFEIADWVGAQQLRIDGTFLTDLHPTGHSFHTACAARGIAAAWDLAVRLGDARRAEHYHDVWRRAMTFMNRLVVQEEDTFWMPEPPMIIGAVRADLTSYELRVDQSGYSVLALLAGLRAQAKMVEAGMASQPVRNNDTG